jgi:BON domain
VGLQGIFSAFSASGRAFSRPKLVWEPSVDALSIEVSASPLGVIIMKGVVRTFAEKVAAERAAKRVRGVHSVVNEVDVRLATWRPARAVQEPLVLVRIVPESLTVRADSGATPIGSASDTTASRSGFPLRRGRPGRKRSSYPLRSPNRPTPPLPCGASGR